MDDNAPACRHCGSPVPANRADEFCCSGCSYVFDLLHEQGLEQFYDLKGGQSLPPVPAQAMRERDYQWLDDLVNAVEQPELSLSVQGLSCVGCVWLIEKVFSRHNGALRIHVDVVRGEVRFTWQRGAFSPVEFAREFFRDWERLTHSGRHDMNQLKAVMLLLVANDAPLAPKWLDYTLTGQWANHRECHAGETFY